MTDILIDPTKVARINDLGRRIRTNRARAANLLRQVTLLENEVNADEQHLKALLQGMAVQQPSQDVPSLMVESIEVRRTPTTSTSKINYK